jgi:hypothetical protein
LEAVPAMIEADTKRIGKHKPYGEFGKLLDALACARDVRGPYNIARRLKDVGGYEVSGQAVSNYLCRKYLPKHAFVEAFCEAFGFTHQERRKLALAYTFPRSNPCRTLHGHRRGRWEGARGGISCHER